MLFMFTKRRKGRGNEFSFPDLWDLIINCSCWVIDLTRYIQSQNYTLLHKGSTPINVSSNAKQCDRPPNCIDLTGPCVSVHRLFLRSLESSRNEGSRQIFRSLKWFWTGAFNCQMSNPAGKDGAWIRWMMKCYYRVAIESQIVFSLDCVLLWNDYGALCCESVKIWIGKRSQDKGLSTYYVSR